MATPNDISKPLGFVRENIYRPYNEVRAAMDSVDWTNVYPVVDSDGCLTGAISDSGDADTDDYELCDIRENGNVIRGEFCTDAQILKN